MVSLGWCWRGPAMCTAMVPNGGKRATLWGSLWTTLRWCPEAYVALEAWLSSQYLLQVWADTTSSYEFMLLLGKSIPGQANAAGFGNKISETCAKGILHFISSLSERDTWFLDASFLVPWVHISPFLYAKCYLVIVSRGHGLLFKQGISWRWFYILQMVCSNGMFQRKTDDTILLLIAS